MFGKVKNEDLKPTMSGATIIAQGTVITGGLSCDNDIRIDGTLQGDIESQSKVVIGVAGSVQGIIHCKQADIMGAVDGDIYATELLAIRSKAQVKGNIYTASLELENTAVFNGRCEMQAESRMTSSVAEKSKAKQEAEKKLTPQMAEAS